MSEKRLIAIVAGARPNFMKVAPVVHALHAGREAARSAGIDLRVSIVHTGQHYDENMSDIFFRDLRIPKPDRHLEVGSGSHASQTARIMVAFEEALLADRPDLVVVVGDVNSTIACALTARKLGVKVAHVEAGLRSFDAEMPEEINRKLTDAISDLLFVTEESGIRNLRAEGVPAERIFLVGNVMIDTLKRNLSRVESGEFSPSPAVGEFCRGARRYAALTLHRPSNVDSPDTLLPLWGAISEIARRIPVLFPVHPRTRAKLQAFGIDGTGVTMIDPVGYLDMLYAVRGAAVVLTDSGGLQEETTALGVPCITIRENTERPVTVELGTNYLAGTKPEAILSAAREILSGKAKRGAVPPLWDGEAAGRIAAILLRSLGSAL
ncbi:MAG: UDP-N-acetylglucosamine 2-epimerase (non-hydrolyzing) [Deltaproteobacteria bacterium]|nr:UDP-N-acetylglucosamine 2-epimerase (non-hydrolyzing) [Deltaproteobacteria bacterium]